MFWFWVSRIFLVFQDVKNSFGFSQDFDRLTLFPSSNFLIQRCNANNAITRALLPNYQYEGFTVRLVIALHLRSCRYVSGHRRSTKPINHERV
jgi:hypothetical protein